MRKPLCIVLLTVWGAPDAGERSIIIYYYELKTRIPGANARLRHGETHRIININAQRGSIRLSGEVEKEEEEDLDLFCESFSDDGRKGWLAWLLLQAVAGGM